MDDQEYLRYTDFILKKEHLNEEWITVVNDDDYRKDGLLYQTHIVTVLVRNKPEFIEKVLSKYTWDFFWEYMGRLFNDESGSADIDREHIILKDGIELETFIFRKDFSDNSYEIGWHFKKFFNLSYDSKKENYIDPQNNVVVQFIKPNIIKIRSDYLRKYLKNRDMMLVRGHQHFRHVTKPIMKILGKAIEEFSIDDQTRKYSITIVPNREKPEYTFSGLLGKDIILP